MNNLPNEKRVGETVTKKVQIITFKIILLQRRSINFFYCKGQKNPVGTSQTLGLETRRKSGKFYDDICFQFYVLFILSIYLLVDPTCVGLALH